MGEHLGRSLVGAHHADRAVDRALVELVAALEQTDQFLEQAGDALGVAAAHRDLVAAHRQRGVGEVPLDLTQVQIALAQQG